MIWASNNKWGSKLRQKQAPQNRSTPRLLPPTWASAAESPWPKHQGQEPPRGSPSLPCDCENQPIRTKKIEGFTRIGQVGILLERTSVHSGTTRHAKGSVGNKGCSTSK